MLICKYNKGNIGQRYALACIPIRAARVEVAAVVVVTMAVELVSPLTLYRPSATVLFYFVLKLIFSENKRNLKNL